ncbi:MAG TPA: hypothetical protein PKY87_14690 [Terricaulis sp.]|nr:hypothetical protein [Terricaulis sp.]
MSREQPPRESEAAFEVALDPAPKAEIIEGEEDEEAAARRAAALASTYDPEIARAGKSEEELIAERAAETRQIVDVAIAVGVVMAVIQAEEEAQNEAEAGVTPGTAEIDPAWDGLSTEDLTLTELDDGE